jgi:hypothetical protein
MEALRGFGSVSSSGFEVDSRRLSSPIPNETVEKPIDNLAGIAEGVDLGGVLFFLRISALS